jgi:hypothetical protein
LPLFLVVHMQMDLFVGPLFSFHGTQCLHL